MIIQLPEAIDEDFDLYSALPLDLRNAFNFIVAAEPDDDDEDDDDDDEDESEDDDDDDDEEPDASGGKGKKKDPKSETKDPEGKSRASRQAARYRTQRNELRQQVRDLEAKQNGDKDAEAKLKEATERADKAEASLRTSQINLSVVKHAGKLKFRDVDDAISHIARKLDADVDPDEVDDEVQELLEALAKEKPYLLSTDGDEEDDEPDKKKGDKDDDEELPSGSSTRKRKKNKHELDEEALRKKYPALAR